MTDTSDVTGPAFVLDFGEGRRGEFKAHAKGNAFLLVRYMDDLFSDQAFTAAKAAIALAVDQVLPEEQERLQQFLMDNGRAENLADAIYDALNATWSGETSFPLAPSSGSSEPTSPIDGGTSSTDGSSSPATPATDDGVDAAKTRRASGSRSQGSPSRRASQPRTRSSRSKATPTQ